MGAVASSILVKLPPFAPVALYHWKDNLPPSVTVAITDRVASSPTCTVISPGWLLGIDGRWALVRLPWLPPPLLTLVPPPLGGVLTVMVKLRVKLVVAVAPFIIVALTTTVPAAVVCSVFSLMVAPVVPGFCMLHDIVRLVALLGTIVPDKARGVPTVAVVGTPVIFVTEIWAAIGVAVSVTYALKPAAFSALILNEYDWLLVNPVIVSPRPVTACQAAPFIET